MTCPSCGKEMTRGYIQCRDGVTWTPKLWWAAALTSQGKDSVSLENGAADNARAVYAFHCKDCRKVMIEY